MRHFPAYLVAFLALVSALVSCGKNGRVIPKEKMAEIYAEMYVMDQWLDDNRSLRREADTSLVYAPVLDKHGYTYDDYLNSVSTYMKDPTRYSRILRRTSEILNGRLAELKSEKKAREEALKESRRLDSLRNLVRLNLDSLMKTMARTNPSDSLAAGLDSLGFVEFRFMQTNDTTFDGPAMIIRIDSARISVTDSLSAVDSCGRAEDAGGLAVIREKSGSAPADSVNAVPSKGTLPERLAAPEAEPKLLEEEPRLVKGGLPAPESKARRRRIQMQ